MLRIEPLRVSPLRASIADTSAALRLRAPLGADNSAPSVPWFPQGCWREARTSDTSAPVALLGMPYLQSCIPHYRA
ncbi:hypothetical protein H3J60_004527 [Salmonella enterica]|nr:hypothetical protein [Salmonella enterica]